MKLGPLLHVHADQGSATWLSAREGRATASDAHRLLTDTGKVRTGAQVETFALELAAETIWGHGVTGFAGSAATEHGNEQEPIALAAYAMVKNVDVRTPGFHYRTPGVGCSPDGLTGEPDAPGTVLVEVKSPQPVQALRARRYAEAAGEPMGCYLAQIHWSLYVLDLPAADHVIWCANPELDERLSITRVERSAAWDEACAEAAANVLGLRDEIIAAERPATTTEAQAA